MSKKQYPRGVIEQTQKVDPRKKEKTKVKHVAIKKSLWLPIIECFIPKELCLPFVRELPASF